VRILILDDNADALLVLENFLKTLDHKVSAYTDGREALLWLKEVNPQLIIADLDMPVMDGFDFLRHVRAYHAFVHVPIICITGTSMTDAQIAAGGFSSTLRKPVTLSDVMAAIEEVENELNSASQQTPPPAPSAVARD
jgi:CheY-like chemotaxis protein